MQKERSQMTIIAKPIVDKQFWILQENDRKVGNIEANAGGYQVRIHNQVSQFKTIRLAASTVNIEFAPAVQITRPKVTQNHVHGYPAAGRVHNPMWDVGQRLPIYTKTNKSKSWFSAGWYNVRKGRNWQTVQSPKLIVLQRYPYQGPYYTEQAAHDSACN
jgi:hypothetical protein